MSIGSSTTKAFVFSANLFENSPAAFFITINLFAAMQLCPEFIVLPVTAFYAANSTSASSKTINGSEPPSSSTTFFKFLPASSAILAPAAVLPVNETP